MREIILQDLGIGLTKQSGITRKSLLQQKIKAKQSDQTEPDYLLFVEHDPVYTLGKNGKEKNLLINQQYA